MSKSSGNAGGGDRAFSSSGNGGGGGGACINSAMILSEIFVESVGLKSINVNYGRSCKPIKWKLTSD